MRRSILPTVLLLLAAVAGSGSAEADLRLSSARAAALGGVHAALADDLDTLFGNPAGFRAAEPGFMLGQLTLGLSGPIFDMTSVVLEGTRTGADPVSLLASANVQDLLRSLYASLNLLGPLSFAYVGNGLGFGFFNDYSLGFSTQDPSSAISLDMEESFLFAGGYALRIPLPEGWRSTLDVGALLKATISGAISSNRDALGLISAASDPGSLVLGAPFRLALGAGMDLGVRYAFAGRVAVALVGRNLYAPRLYYDYSSLSGFLASETPSPSTGLEPLDLSAGVMLRPPLGVLQRYITDLTLLLDYQDILDFLTHPATARNPILHIGLGLELRLLEILSIRAGLAEGLLSGGLGFDLGVLTLSMAMFGTELSAEPGQRPVLNILLGLAFTL